MRVVIPSRESKRLQEPAQRDTTGRLMRRPSRLSIKYVCVVTSERRYPLVSYNAARTTMMRSTPSGWNQRSSGTVGTR